MRVDGDGWLQAETGDPEVLRFPTVRTSRLVVPVPLGIVWHYTGGRGGPGFAEKLARRAQTYRRGVDRPASWNVLVGKDGKVYQSASFLVGTWHVGRPGVIGGMRVDNVNRVTVGCELENAGRLRRIRDQYYGWPYFTNPTSPAYERRPHPRFEVDAARAVEVPGQGTFDAFPAEQEHAAAKLLGAFGAAYGWRSDVCAYAHQEFDPERREDPGPVWMRQVLPRILTALFGGSQASVQESAPTQAQGG